MRLLKWFLICTIILLIALIFMSPGFISATSYTEETPQSNSITQLVSIPDGATPTPTPFQPLPPTPTFLPPVESLSSNAKPKKAANQVPPDSGPAPSIPPGSRVNLLLLGSDQRPYEGGFRTDTIILVSLDPSKGKANLVSFPRDLYVLIPGWTQQRINTAMGYGGFPLLANTLEYNFGVRPTYYVMVNFFAFEQTIDSLGGIDVNVAEALSDHRDKHGNYNV
jgi:anionic cell wall polymer biosynthesis LytR-Cps2A-Psr (LCP) family protein